MTQQHIAFEWVLEDSKTDSQRLSHADGAVHSSELGKVEQRIAIYLLRGIVLLFIIIAAASAAGITPAERERSEAQKGITQTLLFEGIAWQQRDRSLYESLLDPDLDKSWKQSWLDYWRAAREAKSGFDAQLLDVRKYDYTAIERGVNKGVNEAVSEAVNSENTDYMQATVLTRQPAFEWSQTDSYREQRFYRRIGQQWLRTMPPLSQWGEMRQITTPHLRFIYYARDEDAVQAAAPKLEKAYVGIYRALNLPDPPLNSQTISVRPEPIARWTTTISQLEVTSPQLAQIPDGQSDGEYLAYDVMNWLTYRVVGDTVPSYGVRYLYRWPILIWGIRGWLRDELLDQPSPWHDQALKVLRQSAPRFLPVKLADITDVHSDTHPTRQTVILRYLAAESFIKFVTNTYGTQHLTTLFNSLTHYSSWGEIIRVTYGLSIGEFEARWNAHLIKEYGLEEVAPK